MAIIRKNINKVMLILTGVVLATPVFADPQGKGINAPGACGLSGTINSGILKGVPCDRPITDLSVILALIKRIIGDFALPAVGTLFVVMFMYGAFWYITSAGLPDRAKKGREILTQAIIGLLIVVTAEILIGIFATAIGGGVK